MLKTLIALILMSAGVLAHAGGVQCQVNNTCECQANGTCDKFGNPIARPSGLIGAPETASIVCDDSSQLILEMPLSELPNQGTVPAEFRGFPMPIHNYVNVYVNPVFHTRVIEFPTAFCGYRFDLVEVSATGFQVLKAAAECEGATRQLQCHVL